MSFSLLYDPSNCYWFVADDTSRVWSSATLLYVDPDGDVNFRQFLENGGVVSRNSLVAELADVMNEQVLPTILARGLQVTFASTPALNAIYGADQASLDLIGGLARDVGAGLGLPEGASTIAILDVVGNSHDLAEADVRNLYIALRDYKSALVAVVAQRILGTAPPLPLPAQPVAVS